LSKQTNQNPKSKIQNVSPPASPLLKYYAESKKKKPFLRLFCRKPKKNFRRPTARFVIN
jgi:hypothetical protein